MAKKLILLLLLIPIVVMILLFAATQTVSNLVDVPVTGIEIIGEESFVYLDMDKSETYSLEYAVYPTTAKNKNVSISTEAISNEHLAEFDFEMTEGKVILKPLSAGAAKITLTTVSGGFKDSIIVYVESQKLQAIDASVSKNELLVGETVEITTAFLPENPSNTIVNYVSSNPKVASVSANGVISALSKGVATISVISEEDPNVLDTVTVVVKNKDAMDLGITDTTVFYGRGSIPISIDTTEAFTLADLSYQIFDKNGNPVPASDVNAIFKMDGDSITLDYEFTNKTFVGDIIIEITFGTGADAITKSCTVSKVDEIGIRFGVEGAFGMMADQQSRIPYILTPEDAEVTYTVSVDNDNIKAEVRSAGVIIVAYKAGVTKVTLTAKSTDGSNQEQTAEIYVVVQPKNVAVTESAKTYGIENLFTVGGYEYDANGNLILTAEGNRQIALHFQTSTELGYGFAENFKWESSAPEVLIDANGVISFANGADDFAGEVAFQAVFSYGDIEVRTPAHTVRCVANGVNVYSYADLHYATTAELPVVLQNDIVDDFGYINGQLTYAGEIDTTYDITYYENTNRKDETKVKVLVNFKNDVYGNDHAINAHNVTYKFQKDQDGNYIEDNNGNKKPDLENALFKGPLSFVEMHEDNKAVTSFKAQDNICFAVYEGVTITNVKLRGCDLAADADGNQNLVDLSYVGTTVEVLGDDVKIEYSRISNGRTVLRVFGDIDDSEKPIHLTVANSVLEGAREFILRIGSNRFVNGTDDNMSPALPGDDGDDYNSKKEYYAFTEEQKQAYDNKYINTFVTVKDSVLKDTAIFAIGMDSHFAGPALHNGKALGSVSQSFEKYLGDWYNLAKTSYGAKLHFEGNVELCNWKKLEDIDSSSLIEVTGVSAFKMGLNLQEMVSAVAKIDAYKNIVTPYQNATFVHAGIAFFGGGKNYSVFDSDGNLARELGQYAISLETANRSELQFAAGYEDFYFFIHDLSSTFTPQVQQEKIQSGEIYDCIYRK